MGVGIPLPKQKQTSSNGKTNDSKPFNVGSIPTVCAIFSHSSMDRTTSYELVNWGSSPHVKTIKMTQ